MSAIFINLSNHPSDNWTEKQLNAVNALVPNAEVIDIPFPNIDSMVGEDEIAGIADDLAERIVSYSPQAVMCQGEFGVTFRVVTLLKEKGITVVYSCSKRQVIEKITESGTEKTSVFVFGRFRKY